MKRDEVKAIIPGITDEQLDKVMDLNGADIEKHKQTIATLTTERDTARTQLGEANRKLEGYDPDWKQKAEQAEKDAAAQVEAVRFDARLDAAIGKARGRSAKAIKALLDLDTLRQSKEPDKDIPAALDALAKDSGYLFEPEAGAAYAAGTGTTPPAGDPDAALRAAFGLPPTKSEN